MTMCSRCHKRVAVVFMTKIENGESKQEGICIKCARELGIKPVNDMIDKMGLSDDDIERMSSEIENLMQGDETGALEGIMGGFGKDFPEDEDDVFFAHHISSILCTKRSKRIAVSRGPEAASGWNCTVKQFLSG